MAFSFTGQDARSGKTTAFDNYDASSQWVSKESPESPAYCSLLLERRSWSFLFLLTILDRYRTILPAIVWKISHWRVTRREDSEAVGLLAALPRGTSPPSQLHPPLKRRRFKLNGVVSIILSLTDVTNALFIDC